MAQVMQVAGNPIRPTRHWGSHPFTLYLCQERERQPSGSQRDSHQEEIREKYLHSIGQIFAAVGGYLTQSQQVGQARILVGPAARHLIQARTHTYTSTTHPGLYTKSPGIRLTRWHQLTAKYQQPGLDRFILTPQDRGILKGRCQHCPPLSPPTRPLVLHRPVSLQCGLGLCNPGYTIQGRLHHPPLHHT